MKKPSSSTSKTKSPRIGAKAKKDSKPQAPRAKRQNKPKHTVVTRAFCFPMEVSPKQHDRLMAHLSACWRLRNNLVYDRIRNRISCKLQKQLEQKPEYLDRAAQYSAIPEYVRRDTALSKVHSQVRQNVAVRVDEGYKRFFDALKEGKIIVHPPKFIMFKKYRSFTFPQYGTAARIKNSTLHLSGLGDFSIRSYRKIKGKPKTITVKFKQGRWWCIVTAEAQEKDVLPAVDASESKFDVAIDMGLATLMADSFGETYDPPKAWYDRRKDLATAQKKMSRQFEARRKQLVELAAKAGAQGEKAPAMRDVPYSNRLKRQIKAVAKIHTKIDNIRDYHHKKNAAVIAERYKVVAVEEHGVQFMIRNRRLAKVASDRAISAQKMKLKSKLGPRYKEAATMYNGVGNSQVCVCGTLVPKKLEDRAHVCPVCGIVADRDHMAANVVSVNVFGFASTSLHSPAVGQTVVRRGEDKTPTSESRQGESVAGLPQASESSQKRQPLVQVRYTTGAEATVGGKTASHRRRAVIPPSLQDEPKPAAISVRSRSSPPDNMHAPQGV